MLVVASSNGVFTLDDHGEVGPRSMPGKQCMAMAVAPTTGEIAISIFKAGVFLSDDHGISWRSITEDLPHIDVRALAFDHQTPAQLYAGTEPAELYRSTLDGGGWEAIGSIRSLAEAKNWSFPVPPRTAHVRTIEISRSDSQTLFVGIEVGSYLVSRDGGETWIVSEGVGHDLHRTIIHPDRPDCLIVATGLDTGRYRGKFGLYRSEDAGASWDQANQGLGHRLYTEDAIAFDVANPDVVYLAAADGIPPKWASMTKLAAGALSGNVYFLNPSRFRRRKGADTAIYRSDDAGRHWKQMADPDEPGFFDMIWALETGLNDAGDSSIYYGTTGGSILISTDRAQRWSTVADDLGPITHLKPLAWAAAGPARA